MSWDYFMLMQRFGVRLLATLFFVTSGISAFASEGRAIFSSYANELAARLEAINVEKVLGIRTLVVEALVNGRTYYRVASETTARDNVRRLISRAKAQGVSGAWYLASTSNDAPRAVRGSRVRMTDNVPSTSTRITQSSSPTSVNRVEQNIPIAKPVTLSGSEEVVSIPRIDEASITLDGRVDESVWTSVPPYTKLLVIDPDTLAEPDYPSAARIFYTDKGIYVGAVLEQPVDTLVERLSSRDKQLSRDDFGIAIDTSGDGSSGFFFNVSLGGTKSDG